MARVELKVGQWAWSDDEERYQGPFETREQAIDAAREYLFGDSEFPEPNNRIVWVGQIGEVADIVYALCTRFDAEFLRDEAEEHFADNFCNEDALLDEVTPAQWKLLEEHLRAAVKKWAEATGASAYYFTVEHKTIEEIVIHNPVKEPA